MRIEGQTLEKFEQSEHVPTFDLNDGWAVSDSVPILSSQQACLRALKLAEQMRCCGMNHDAHTVYNLFSKTGNDFPRAARFAGLAAIDFGDIELFDRVRADLVAFAARTRNRDGDRIFALLDLEFRLHLRIADDEPAWLSRLDIVNTPQIRAFNLAFLCIAQLLVKRQYAAALAACHSLSLIDFSPVQDDTEGWEVWLRLAAAVCCRELHRHDEMVWWCRRAATIAAATHCIQPYFEFIAWSRDPLLLELDNLAPNLAAEVLRKEHAIFINMIRVRNHLTGGAVTDQLSRRQMFVASHINDGCSYREIAEMQGISLGRLRNYCMGTYRTLKIHRRGELRGRVF